MQHASFSPLNGSYPVAPNAPGYHLLLEEAREIRYKERDLLYIFYSNQITNLSSRCPDPSKKMDLLLASCQDEARQVISEIVPPVPGWDVNTQIEKAFCTLRLRYGCSSFVAEPLIKQGPKLTCIDIATLEQLISDLNNCELYARAHKQISSLDGSFILDIGERCPTFFKNK